MGSIKCYISFQLQDALEKFFVCDYFFYSLSNNCMTLVFHWDFIEVVIYWTSTVIFKVIIVRFDQNEKNQAKLFFMLLKKMPECLNVQCLKKKSNVLRYPASNFMFKVNNKNIRTRCEIFSKLTINLFLNWRRSGVYIVNFEHISHLNFGQVNSD